MRSRLEAGAANNYTANAFAMAGYVAAKVFLAGLENVEGELTFASFIDAMESEPIQVPMGGEIEKANVGVLANVTLNYAGDSEKMLRLRRSKLHLKVRNRITRRN